MRPLPWDDSYSSSKYFILKEVGAFPTEIYCNSKYFVPRKVRAVLEGIHSHSNYFVPHIVCLEDENKFMSWISMNYSISSTPQKPNHPTNPNPTKPHLDHKLYIVYIINVLVYRYTVRMRVSARVGVSAQGCGKKAGSKWFNSNTAQGSESPHTVRRLRPLRQGWAICPAFCAIKHVVLQGLVSRAPLLYFGPASVGARTQLADI